MMYKKEVPRLNKDNLPTQKSLMRLHLVGIGDSVINFCEKYICGDNNSSSNSSKTKREARTQASYVRDYINPKLCQVL